MDAKYLIKKAEQAYYNYRKKCGDVAIEAQKYISWDNNVGCEYLPSDGLCILATVSNDYSNGGMPKKYPCVVLWVEVPERNSFKDCIYFGCIYINDFIDSNIIIK